MSSFRLIRLSVLVAILAAISSQAAKAQDAGTTHSFLGCGKANQVVLVAEDNSVQWKYEHPASDGWVLPNGNVLLALYPSAEFPKGGVIEVEPKSNTVLFKYQGQQGEISTAIALDSDRFLITELGPAPQAIIVNRRGETLKSIAFECQKPNTHMQTRMARLLPNGNIIAPHLLDFAVKEYDYSSGKVLAVFKTDDRGEPKHDWPFTAIRLSDGNTLIGCTNGNRVIEVDSKGKIVWSVTNEDLGKELIDDACGVQRLPNGNTVIASYHATGDRVKLLEVTRDKKVVWTYSGMKAGFHHFQILTTNGKKLENNAMK